MRVGNVIPWRRTREAAPAWPAAGFPSLLRDLDRMLDDFWRGAEPPTSFERGSRSFAPDLDVEETASEIRVKADLPGLSEKDFEVTIEGDLLTIEGERRDEREHEEHGQRWTERCYGRFTRSVRLPAEVEADKAAAAFAKGVLTVTVPKSAATAARSRKVEVRSA